MESMVPDYTRGMSKGLGLRGLRLARRHGPCGPHAPQLSSPTMSSRKAAHHVEPIPGFAKKRGICL